MLKINVLGTHATGKSTLCFQIANYLKQKNINVKIIAENIRECPFPINKQATIDTELWVFHKCFLEELEAKAQKYEAVILDRGVLDGIVYFEERNTPNEYFSIFKDLAYHWVEEEYDLLILVEPSDIHSSYLVDEVRDPNIAYRKDIMLKFREFIDRLPEYMKKQVVSVHSDDIFHDYLMPPAMQTIKHHIETLLY